MSLAAITWNALLRKRTSLGFWGCWVSVQESECQKGLGFSDLPVKHVNTPFAPPRQLCFSAQPLLTLWRMSRSTPLTLFLDFLTGWTDAETSGPVPPTHLSLCLLCLCVDPLFHCVYIRQQSGPSWSHRQKEVYSDQISEILENILALLSPSSLTLAPECVQFFIKNSRPMRAITVLSSTHLSFSLLPFLTSLHIFSLPLCESYCKKYMFEFMRIWRLYIFWKH